MKNRGMNLIELLVVMVLLIIFLGITSTLVWLAGNYWFLNEGKNRVTMNAHLAMENLRRDLWPSNYASFTNETGGTTPAIGFQSALDNNKNFVTGIDGKPVWQRYIIYYLQTSTNTLLKREIAPSPPTIAPLSPAALLSYCNGQGKPVARYIKVFTAATDSAEKSITFTLTPEIAYQQKNNRLVLEAKILPFQK